jgi:hypothetical protein
LPPGPAYVDENNFVSSSRACDGAVVECAPSSRSSYYQKRRRGGVSPDQAFQRAALAAGEADSRWNSRRFVEVYPTIAGEARTRGAGDGDRRSERAGRAGVRMRESGRTDPRVRMDTCWAESWRSRPCRSLSSPRLSSLSVQNCKSPNSQPESISVLDVQWRASSDRGKCVCCNSTYSKSRGKYIIAITIIISLF